MTRLFVNFLIPSENIEVASVHVLAINPQPHFTITNPPAAANAVKAIANAFAKYGVLDRIPTKPLKISKVNDSPGNNVDPIFIPNT